ncbi:MAG: prepilin-type N-terminal cleavage/methylation domain-containing protein [Phycisphaerae bacterium]
MRMQTASRAHRAFTLIELLVVISIILLLVSVLLPSLSSARIQAKRTVTLAHLRGIGIAMTAYQNDNNDAYPAMVDRAEKAFLGLSLLASQHNLDPRLLINPNTLDTHAAARSEDGRPILADLGGVAITSDTPINTSNIGQVRFHCSYSYDNDVKEKFGNTGRSIVYLGDRADYENGRTFSANWGGEGMGLLWTDGHGEFRRKKSLREQSDPNIYHHNEWMGEGGAEVVDGVSVTKRTLDTHLRFFSEEEDDALLPD